ncbi:endonuclease/exonuclease/phosphatase family protein [Kitasatospora sp. NPDC058965]|uniref:endonuclease/exonuclease/phosphatase family protein n=1 Tax=Kitasatospora sp. NPDC058965 TaxID=3346682 RepID=UPI0036AB5575
MPTGSSLTLSSSSDPVEGDKLSFHWTTDAPDAKNWVGLYDGTRRPGTGASLLWKYTPAASGDVALDTSALTGGPYTAYLLAKDGYGVLAQSAPFSFRPKPAVVPPHCAVDALTATPVAPGEQVAVRLSGLWTGTTAPGFRRTGGDSWLSVSADGVVTGTAPGKPLAHPAVITVAVKDAGGAGDTLTVQVPVVEPKGRRSLKTASLNLWDAGAHTTDAREKQLRVVLAQGWDVVALQETGGTAARALADALGWYAYQSPGSVGVLSRYPLTDVTPATADLPAAGVTVQVPGGRSGSGPRTWTRTATGPTRTRTAPPPPRCWRPRPARCGCGRRRRWWRRWAWARTRSRPCWPPSSPPPRTWTGRTSPGRSPPRCRPPAWSTASARTTRTRSGTRAPPGPPPASSAAASPNRRTGSTTCSTPVRSRCARPT